MQKAKTNLVSNQDAEEAISAAHGSGLTATRAGRFAIDGRNAGFWVVYFFGAVAVSLGIALAFALVTRGVY